MDKSIFELIIDGQIPSMKVYEDDNFIAFLDIAPKQKGHTLVVPKVKNTDIINDSEYVQENILKLGSKIALQLKETLGATGVRMVFNNGASAGQEVFHTHLHLIPFYDEEQEKINNEDILNKIIKRNI